MITASSCVKFRGGGQREISVVYSADYKEGPDGLRIEMLRLEGIQVRGFSWPGGIISENVAMLKELEAELQADHPASSPAGSHRGRAQARRVPPATASSPSTTWNPWRAPPQAFLERPEPAAGNRREGDQSLFRGGFTPPVVSSWSGEALRLSLTRDCMIAEIEEDKDLGDRRDAEIGVRPTASVCRTRRFRSCRRTTAR